MTVRPDNIVVILTALPEEFKEVRQRISHPEKHRVHPGTIFHIGALAGTEWKVALTQVGEGNLVASGITERAIKEFSPRAVMFVGVAAGLREDIALADVVVASKVYEYHSGKEEANQFLSRPAAWEMDHAWLQEARDLNTSDQWRDSLPPGATPHVHIKPIAAGQVVVDSQDSVFIEWLRTHFNDAVALEMESAGFAQAAAHHRDVAALSVRGISDYADGAKGTADGAGTKQPASAHAAVMALAIIRAQPVPSPTTVAPASAPGWFAGATIKVRSLEYILNSERFQREPLADDAASLITARGMRTDASQSTKHAYGWIRRTETKLSTPATARHVAALEHEHTVLTASRSSRLPEPIAWEQTADSCTLVLDWPVTAAGRPWALAQQLLTGRAVDAWRLAQLRKGFAQLCEALDTLHARGMTHRDLGPESILVSDSGDMRLRDLGLAGYDTFPGEGPHTYRAPEQDHLAATATTPATDGYQLAAVFYHLASGRPPHPESRLPLTALVPEVDSMLAGTTLRMLAPRPSDRDNLTAFRAALRAS